MISKLQNKPSEASKLFRVFIEIPEGMNRKSIEYVSLKSITQDVASYLKPIIGDIYASSSILHIDNIEYKCIQGYFDELDIQKYTTLMTLNLGVARIDLLSKIFVLLHLYYRNVKDDHKNVHGYTDTIVLNGYKFNMVIMVFNPDPLEQYTKNYTGKSTRYIYSKYSEKMRILKKQKEYGKAAFRFLINFKNRKIQILED